MKTNSYLRKTSNMKDKDSENRLQKAWTIKKTNKHFLNVLVASEK